MNIRQYLGQNIYLTRQIELGLRQIEVLTDRANRASMVMSDTGIYGTTDHLAREKYLADLIDMKNRISEEIIIFSEQSKAIVNVIRSVKNKQHRLLLEYRYINGLTWTSIAELMRLSRREVYRVHTRALEEVKLYMPEDFSG